MRVTRLSKCLLLVFCISVVCYHCAKKNSTNENPPPPPPANFDLNTWAINGNSKQTMYYGISNHPVITLHFAASVDHGSTPSSIVLKENGNTVVPFNTTYQNGFSVLLQQPAQPLSFLKPYTIVVSNTLKSAVGGHLNAASTINFNTGIDSTNKFPIISDSALLDLVQQQTFKYFWDFGHPVSGLARERNTSGETVTTGGSGFGIMALRAAVNRNFISHADGLARMQ